MNVQHQVSDELLLDYASGNLSEGWSLAVATHLALCPQARRRLQAMEGAAGALFDKISVSAKATDADWDKMKAKLSGSRSAGHTVARPSQSEGVIPEPLRSYLGGDVSSLKWKALGRGAYQIRIDTGDPDTQVRLLRIPAGKPVPEHTHDGRELTLVLAGSFHDGQDLFARGDLEEADGSLLHTPTATEGEDCICLAVTERPLKFSSWVVRMIQPILKI
ncbi:transcriptional regulator [Rhizobium sp. Root149]|jgi:putative transcriptional regulator|uniref:Putative transcriptional regulator n=1 Tax=Rhizobium rhizoryzae TaxID=451876 RepID=A0A7W6LFW8_9HYPH|nr:MULTISPECIES: ChrR family anti-sigma-E factor [Rhizobium]KQZ50456.1 transcriptional regulator [Rhizobium sp. Root149]MBB4143629.1 putative transcriptional regulator [Rhizobium rhizoryzae]